MNAFEMVRISMELQQPKWTYAWRCDCGQVYTYRHLQRGAAWTVTERCATCDLQREARQ